LWPPTILYASSSPEFELAYREVSATWGLELTWQLPLKQRVLEAVNPEVPLITFLVDDDVFFRDFQAVDPPLGRSFSPRLGDNCTYCYPYDRPQRKGEMDFTYFFSIDCHVYRTADVLPRIEAATFETPNQFEDALSRGEPLAIDYASHSCLVGIPHNKVCEYGNRNAGGSNVELNHRFLQGERIDPEAMDFSAIIGAHQEVPYAWKKRADAKH
jgi:hypothetical protein